MLLNALADHIDEMDVVDHELKVLMEQVRAQFDAVMILVKRQRPIKLKNLFYYQRKLFMYIASRVHYIDDINDVGTFVERLGNDPNPVIEYFLDMSRLGLQSLNVLFNQKQSMNETGIANLVESVLVILDDVLREPRFQPIC